MDNRSEEISFRKWVLCPHKVSGEVHKLWQVKSEMLISQKKDFEEQFAEDIKLLRCFQTF